MKTKNKKRFLFAETVLFLPLFSSSERIATAPVWARASVIKTPGIIGLPGKCPPKYHSLIQTFL